MYLRQQKLPTPVLSISGKRVRILMRLSRSTPVFFRLCVGLIIRFFLQFVKRESYEYR